MEPGISPMLCPKWASALMLSPRRGFSSLRFHIPWRLWGLCSQTGSKNIVIFQFIQIFHVVGVKVILHPALYILNIGQTQKGYSCTFLFKVFYLKAWLLEIFFFSLAHQYVNLSQVYLSVSQAHRRPRKENSIYFSQSTPCSEFTTPLAKKNSNHSQSSLNLFPHGLFSISKAGEIAIYSILGCIVSLKNSCPLRICECDLIWK